MATTLENFILNLSIKSEENIISAYVDEEGCCAAFNCAQRGEKGVKFHRFPTDVVLKNGWVTALRRDKFVPSNTSLICQKHFKETDYSLNVHGNLILKHKAVPSVFDLPGNLIKSKPARRVLKKKELASLITEYPSTSKGTNVEEELTEDLMNDNTSTVTIDKKLKRLRYIGDFSEADLDCPAKRHKFWKMSQASVKINRTKYKQLQNTIYRQKRKRNSLNELLQDLHKKHNLSLESSLVLKI